MGVGCLGIKKGLRTGQRERPGVGLLRETGIGSSPHMTIRGSEGLGKLVPPQGFEPWALRLQGGRSDLLSYDGELAEGEGVEPLPFPAAPGSNRIAHH